VAGHVGQCFLDDPVHAHLDICRKPVGHALVDQLRADVRALGKGPKVRANGLGKPEIVQHRRMQDL
jgi:hypothetical protein